ncbi:XPG-I-2 domain-containing protein [Mycena indigotica]|uniref:XPG-I-2 domain-containing protein n=1 Tax=Mycena indigotica TaxID=2126181 RepID=A0A8H6WHL5_9AGAR|nr:XPG-I-2 domain-containing protein [Mycena indigotica]KAF7315213.1 XPG-I-2 domain-containing protein [Mycena indigotica]
MGVLGLSTFLRENRHKLANTISTDNTKPRINVVVDGWSFIYNLHRSSGLPWTYGGEYPAFFRVVTTTVNAWVNAGLNAHFVFDGPAPSLKFPTLISRLTQTNVTNSLVFFRTSAASRTSRFLHETRIIPPFCYTACVDSLEELAQKSDHVVIHHADEEGDPFAVELAGRLGAFVIGTDSDFVVLNADGYLGYIPLDEMVWNVPVVEETVVVENEEFQQVRKPKSRKPTNASTTGRGIIPPEVDSGLSLTLSVYTPAKLAAHLDVPIPLLPLLGALVGNDFTNQSSSPRKNVQQLFFERHLSLGQRITRVAATIHTILSASSQKGKQKQIESVMDLIDRTVNALLVRSVSSMGSGEIEEVIDKIVEATLQYALPRNEDGLVDLWPTDICALHEADLCPILPMFSRLVTAEALKEDRENDDELLRRNDIRGQYLTAYRQGRLHSKVLDVLNTQTYWPRIFLEEPNLETVSRVMGRPIRLWGYAILHDSLGLPLRQPIENSEVDEEEERTEDVESEADSDELVDVVESDSDDEPPRKKDLLAPLRGALSRLSGDEMSEAPPSSRAAVPTTVDVLPTVTEYLRRGTRIADEPMVVPSVRDLVSSAGFEFDVGTEPVVLKPEQDRFTLLLRVLRSDTSGVRSIPRQKLMAALCLRWVLQTLSDRALESGTKEREKERWTRHEARSFLSAFTWADSPSPTAPETYPAIEDRNVQLTAQILATLESIVNLSQILLISERLPLPASLFSGMEFHACLTGARPTNVSDDLWDACVSDISETFGDELKKKKKPKRKEVVTPPKGRPVKGLFDLFLPSRCTANPNSSTSPTGPRQLWRPLKRRHRRFQTTSHIATPIVWSTFVQRRHTIQRLTSLRKTTVNRHEPRVVRISESAWFAAVARQLCGGIIDILVSPDPNSPPTYLSVPADMEKEEEDILRQSRSTSPPPPRRSSPGNKGAKRSWLPRIG